MSFVALLCAGAVAAEPIIVCHTNPDAPGFGTIAVAGIPERQLQPLRALTPRAPEWSRLLTVHTGAVPSSVDQPAVLGRYEVDGPAIRFTPRFPFLPRMTYRVHVEGGAGASITERCTMPASPVRERTRVEAIYPSTAEVPENLLRIYIHFSAPMRGKDAQRFVRLYDAEGREIQLPFVEVKEGLWDPSGRRLTLFFHPGRLKRGVAPNRELGPPLRSGETFRLVVDQQLRDLGGEPLAASFEKKLRVVAADRRSPDPGRWHVTVPDDPTGELVLEIGEPLDRALLVRMIDVEDASGQPVPGEWIVAKAETQASFRPRSSWRPGRYTIVVNPALEDLAGNRIDRLFDEELSTSAEPNAQDRLTIVLSFAVGI